MLRLWKPNDRYQRMIIINRLYQYLTTGILLLLPLLVSAQFRSQANDWQLIMSPGGFALADAERTSGDGWTHFYRERDNTLILSIHANGQDIGTVEDNLRITTGLLSGFGRTANDLSGASYVDNSIWLTMNRYWRIEKARPIDIPVRVRFYYSREDYNDLLNGLNDIGLEEKQSGELMFYTLLGGQAHPFANRPEAMRASFRPVPPDTGNRPVPYLNDLYYIEFELTTLAASGSGGFLIPVAREGKSVAGRILRPNGQPLPGVEFPSTLEGAAVVSDEQGYYALANLPAARDFILQPRLTGAPLENLSVLDLVALEKRLRAKQAFDDPYRELAADLDGSGRVDEADLTFLHQLLIGKKQLPTDEVWHFVPASHQFSARGNPLSPSPPGSLQVENLFTDLTDQDFVAVKRGNVADEENFPNEPPVLLDAGFSLPEAESCGADELVGLDLRVSGFDDVMGFQFTLRWDPRVLAFSEVDQYNLPGFNEDCISIDSIGYGILSIAWFTTQTSRATRLPDGTSICRLRFRAIGEDGSETEINFAESPVPIQVLRKNLSPSNVLFTAGRLDIRWETGIGSFRADIQDVTCFSMQDGAIDISVDGSHGPYRYRWSTGATTEDIDSLLPGTYFVTITGQSKCPLVSDSLVVAEPRVLFVHNENVRQIQCPSGTDGAISFKTSGGSPPYIYQWSHGATTPWVGNLGPGDYDVTILDQNGCRANAAFTIDPAPPLRINYGVSPAKGPFDNSGSVTIQDLLGSTPPQEFTWSNGNTGPIARDLAPGEYEVSVTDAARCQYLLKFEVPEQPAPQSLKANLPAPSLPAARIELLSIESPKDQTIQMKIFDSGSQQVWQQVVPLSRGINYLYFTTPQQRDSYLLQLVPRKGRVHSQRFTVYE